MTAGNVCINTEIYKYKQVQRTIESTLTCLCVGIIV